VGKNKNPFTLTNYLYRKIKNKENFIIWNKTKRNLIDIRDIKKIVKETLIKKKLMKNIINIKNNDSLYMEEIVSIFSKILQRKPKYKTSKIKDNFNNNFVYRKSENKFITDFFKEKNYTEKVLQRYYK